ncbi:hypothetical protein F4604DRAFT_1758002 [Suillus subluteus]|nr:hypothetical protein F4604DRAFT_1758002 [Suillus subluteus]
MLRVVRRLFRPKITRTITRSSLCICFVILALQLQSSAERIFKSLLSVYPQVFTYPSLSTRGDDGDRPSKSYHLKNQ